MKHIMLVEDEVELAQLVRDYLEAAGFEVSMFHDGQDAYTQFQQRKPSLMILDLMVPRMDGLTICRKVREQSDLPIIMVTARTEEIDRVLGLNMGADDYICKPFSPKELVARVQAVLRRLERKAEPEQNDLFRIDKAQQRIWYQQKALTLTPTEFRILELFLEHLGQVYSRAQLLDHINPDSFDVWFNTLPLDHNTFNPAEIKDDPMSAIAIDIGYPVVTEQNMSIAIYAQIAKMIGETNYPGNPDSSVSLGSGIIPVGVAAKFGPAHFNLEYRIIPKGNFEFGYWNQTYEVERVSMEGDLIKTKESKLGRFGKQKGIFANFSMDVFGLLGFNMAYQNLRGDIWDGNMFSNQANQSFQSELGLKKSISKIKTAKLFYQQLNVPNPFEFEFTESTVMGYRIGIELGSGMVLNYTYQRTFRMSSDGELEPVNLTGIETSFTF